MSGLLREVGSVSRRAMRLLVLLALGVVALLVQASVAGAVWHGRPSRTPPTTRSNTQLRLSSLGPGQGVSGFIADTGNPFNPVIDGYPDSDPTTGWSPRDEGFERIIVPG